MSKIEFGEVVGGLNDEGIQLAKAHEPDFETARRTLIHSRDIARLSYNGLKSEIYAARVANDLGVVDVREGLYLREYGGLTNEDTLEYVNGGLSKIRMSYGVLLTNILTRKAPQLEEYGWVSAVEGHITGTMNTWFRTTQTAQILAGEIGPNKPADKETKAAQWMVGEGTPDRPGARVRGRLGDNGYWSIQTDLLSARGERINGGRGNLPRAIGTALRGTPELGRRLITDRSNTVAMIKTAGRLSIESRTRHTAMAAALDYRRF
jgi:hypothetical protein